MKGFYSSLLSSLCALAIGILVYLYPSEMMQWIVLVLGILFLIPGLVALLGYVLQSRQQQDAASQPSLFPYAGCGSILFGVVLLFLPHTFIPYTQYVIAVFLVLVGCNRLAQLFRIRAFTPISIWYYTYGILVILCGLFVFLNPFDASLIPMYVLSLGNVLYGLTELWHVWAFRRYLRTPTPTTTPTTTTSSSADSTPLVEAPSQDSVEGPAQPPTETMPTQSIE